MRDTRAISAVVSWPSAPLTLSLVRKSLEELGLPSGTSHIPITWSRLLQWSTYDDIDHELTHTHRDSVLSSSYTIRKALIRKHFLSRTVHAYLAKHPSSLLKDAVPRTWHFELSFADELDDMWSDELWDLGQEIDDPVKWWILKPGMADRGMGIRLFNSKDGLQRIFEEFEAGSSEDEEQSTVKANATAVMVSQLRHFVVQEYESNPILIDPAQVPVMVASPAENLKGHKFHLRVYCVASGALTLYIYTRILALFSASPYLHPVPGDENKDLDLTPHLTNTSLQINRGEEGVRFLDELVGCDILSLDGAREGPKLTSTDLADIVDNLADVLAETFRAALENPVHFQPLPNAFELYGVDFLVTMPPPTDIPPSPSTKRYHVKLLEVNAEPAIELTGARLTWILQDLFSSIGEVCVGPFFGLRGVDEEENAVGCDVGQTRHHLRKCLEVQVRGSC